MRIMRSMAEKALYDIGKFLVVLLAAPLIILLWRGDFVTTTFIISGLIYLALLTLFCYQRYLLQTVVGIRKIDRTMDKGINPSDALRMCTNNFKFLGIAANKLVHSNEFQGALKRCGVGAEPIEFLLLSYESRTLQFAAARASRAAEEYKNMVKYTLERLKKYKEEDGYNIQVRLYKLERDEDVPIFRLFFVDNQFVLVSYYVLGEGSGLQMPQIQVVKNTWRKRTRTFYYAFDHYFKYLWVRSEPYDFSREVDGGV